MRSTPSDLSSVLGFWALPLPNPTLQGVFGLPEQDLDLVGPARHPDTENAGGYPEDGAGIVEGEPGAPGLRSVGEVFLGEGPCERLRALVREGGAERHADDTGQDAGDVQYGVGPGEYIEI